MLIGFFQQNVTEKEKEKGEFLNCRQDVRSEYCYTDRDEFREDIESSHYDFEGTDEEFDKLIESELVKYEPYWKDCIILYVDGLGELKMREILFRGQTRRKGEKVRMDGSPVDSNWVYGGIFPGEGDRSIIYQTKPEINKFPVYSDTVGQYTGLTDKNGVRIFEGDIVRTRKAVYPVCWCTKYCMFALAIDNDDLSSGVIVINAVNAKRIEVIGNIHDNPELLKGEAE